MREQPTSSGCVHQDPAEAGEDPTEEVNGLFEPGARIGCGSRALRFYEIRPLLHAARPNSIGRASTPGPRFQIETPSKG